MRPSERTRSSLTALTIRDAVIVGMAQATALIPGVSRSGITIVAGLTTGLTSGDGGAILLLAGSTGHRRRRSIEGGPTPRRRPRRRATRPLSGRDGHGVCRGVRRDSALARLCPRATTAHLRYLPPGFSRAHRRRLVLRPSLAASLTAPPSRPRVGFRWVVLGGARAWRCRWAAHARGGGQRGGSAPARRHRPDRRPARPGRWAGGQGGCREWRRRGTRRPRAAGAPRPARGW